MMVNNNQWARFALLLIDVQLDFWPAEIAEAFPEFEKNVSRLLAGCRQEGLEVVHLQAEFAADERDWMVRYKLKGSIPCVRGSGGERLLGCAQPAAGEKVIQKQTFDGFLNPELDHYLRAKGKQFVFVAGLVTSTCVLLTGMSAAQRGYLVAMVTDCSADVRAAHDHTVNNYPFAFDLTNSRSLFTSRSVWTAQLDELYGILSDE